MKACPVCPPSVSREEMESMLAEYVAAIPPLMRCSEDTLSQRLRLCENCEYLRDGLCAQCGCYVALRCAKAAMYCPHPAGPRWQQENRKEE